MGTVDWLSWTGAGALALAALLVGGWAFLWDRSRGRRRCPRCWYDMAATPGLRCPECGREAISERALSRTRRRYRTAAAALVLLLPALWLWTPRDVRYALLTVTPAWILWHFWGDLDQWVDPEDEAYGPTGHEFLRRWEDGTLPLWAMRAFCDTERPGFFDGALVAPPLWVAGEPLALRLEAWPLHQAIDRESASDPTTLRLRRAGEPAWTECGWQDRFRVPPDLLAPGPQSLALELEFRAHGQTLASGTAVVDWTNLPRDGLVLSTPSPGFASWLGRSFRARLGKHDLSVWAISSQGPGGVEPTGGFRAEVLRHGQLRAEALLEGLNHTHAVPLRWVGDRPASADEDGWTLRLRGDESTAISAWAQWIATVPGGPPTTRVERINVWSGEAELPIRALFDD